MKNSSHIMIELFYVLKVKFSAVHKNEANSIQFHFYAANDGI